MCCAFSSMPGDVKAEAPGSANSGCDGLRAERVSLQLALSASLERQPQYLIAQQEVEKARAGVVRAYSSFLPSVSATFENDHFVPANTQGRVAIVGNAVVGGQSETYTSYGSLSANLNLYNGGRDGAAYRASKATHRASEAAMLSKLADTLEGVVVAYGDLYKAMAGVTELGRVVASWRVMQVNAIERYKQGHGTTLAIGQVRNQLLDAERELYQACHGWRDKSDSLVKAIGLPSAPGGLLAATGPVPPTAVVGRATEQLEAIVRADPAVMAAQEQLTAAYAKIDQAKGAFLPVVSLFGKKDFLGQSVSGIRPANGALGYDSYRVGIVLQQPLGPFTTEYAELASAKADAAKQEAVYQQTLIDARTKLSTALSAYLEADDAAKSAAESVSEAEQLLSLTQSQFKAGRVARDSVEQAQVGLAKARRSSAEIASDLSVASWRFNRSVQQTAFPQQVFETVNITPDQAP